MIFEQDYLSFQILDVLYMDQVNTRCVNFNRNFDALSFRIEADTVIDYKNGQLDFGDGSIGYFPSNVDYTRSAKKDKMIVVNFNLINYHSNEIELFLPTEVEKYRDLFEQLLSCWQGKSTAYQHKSAAILSTVFAELYKDNIKIYPQKSKIQSSIKYIEKNHLKPDFSLVEAAAKSFISPTYFRKLFRAEFGISPKQYVIKRRINYAASLILTGYYSLQEVAECCGYTDYKHFSAEFKKLLGVSPSQYCYKRNKA